MGVDINKISEDQFKQVTEGSRMSKNAIDSLRMVIFDGKPPAEVARFQGVTKQCISARLDRFTNLANAKLGTNNHQAETNFNEVITITVADEHFDRVVQQLETA